jgi:hypothetical protein
MSWVQVPSATPDKAFRDNELRRAFLIARWWGKASVLRRCYGLQEFLEACHEPALEGLREEKRRPGWTCASTAFVPIAAPGTEDFATDRWVASWCEATQAAVRCHRSLPLGGSSGKVTSAWLA